MRWKCTVAYDGTRFDGWQSQPGKNTIQDTLEAALREITGLDIRVHGSGRTDAGVHARRQVCHFDADWQHGAPILVRALRSKLPETIQVLRIRRVSQKFHARFSASRKRYVYQLYQGYASPFETRYHGSLGNVELDLELMRVAAEMLTGEHDFAAFAATRGQGQDPADTVRRLNRFEINESGKQLRIVVEADGFLYKMVRSLVGALVDVGRGKLAIEQLALLLHSGERTHQVQTAPPRGLILDKVDYGGSGQPNHF